MYHMFCKTLDIDSNQFHLLSSLIAASTSERALERALRFESNANEVAPRP